eukprot:scaffold35617_cov60-Phaeocystis_antarctica.AAC.5
MASSGAALEKAVLNLHAVPGTTRASTTCVDAPLSMVTGKVAGRGVPASHAVLQEVSVPLRPVARIQLELLLVEAPKEAKREDVLMCGA